MPVASRCLLAARRRYLLVAVILAFLVRLQRENTLKTWLEVVGTSLQADLLYTSSFMIASCLVGCWYTGYLASHGIAGTRGSYVFFGVLLMTLAWYSLVKITVLHGLEVMCLLPVEWLERCPGLEDCELSSGPFVHRSNTTPGSRGPQDSPLGIITGWFWVPTGLFHVLARTVLRPWRWMYRSVMCGPHEAIECAPLWWWEWRELVLGCIVATATMLTIVTAFLACIRRVRQGNHVPGQHSIVHGAALAVYIFFLLGIFWLTVEPLIWFWRFALRPPVVLIARACSIADGLWFMNGTPSGDDASVGAQSKLDLLPEEWFSLLVCCWLVVRWACVCSAAEIERRCARWRTDAGLRFAIECPFRADLEEGFCDPDEGAVAASTPAGGRTGAGTPQRSRGVSVDSVSAESIQRKRQAIVRARYQLLRQESMGSAAMQRIYLSVSRQSLLRDSLTELAERPISELLARSMFVTYETELGIDAGGLTRDWFDSVARYLLEQTQDSDGLFEQAADGTLIPRPAPSVETEGGLDDRLRDFVAVGRFLAIAVVRENPLPVALSSTVCKHLLLKPVSMEDVRDLDLEFYQHRVATLLRDGGLAELEETLGEPLTFVSAPTELLRQPNELVPEGATRIVTEENKAEYLMLLCEERLCGGIRTELQCLLQGFWDILPVQLLNKAEVGPRALAVMISGVHQLDPEEWQRCSSGGSDAEVIDWFWDIVRTALSAEQRCLLLHFATGSSCLPPGGFARLQPPFSVQVSTYGSPDRLPQAHTCVNKVVLPHYTSRAQLFDKLVVAICTDGFGLH